MPPPVAPRSRVGRPGHYWPTAAQLPLLRAALLTGDAARASWAEWSAHVDLDRLDGGSERLVPLLAYNLKRHAVADPHLGRFDGLLSYTWAANRRRLAQASRVARALHDARIPTMLLKGMALVRRHYPHPGLRPMDDVDVLVPTVDAPRAVRLLHERGWRSTEPLGDLSATHSRLFVAEDGGRIDLHWHALWEACGADADEEVWTHAESTTLDGTPVWIPSPADLFLHVVVHGARWNPVSPVRWVADAMTLLATAGSAFAWTRLVAQAKAHRLALPLARALEFLVDALDAPVPADVLSELAAHRATRFERFEQAMRERTSPTVGCFPLVLCHHVRLTRAAGPAAVVWRLPRYLQQVYGIPTLRALPVALCSRVARRLRAASGANA